jgi:nitrite reductase/ring-hydroxylating ferredoxin subunit
MSARRVISMDVTGLAPGSLRAIEADGRRILVCNAAGRFYALENRCPHIGVPLDGGRLEGTTLECPLHGGRLDVRDGTPQALPIRRRAVTFAVREVQGGIEIDPSEEDTACTT